MYGPDASVTTISQHTDAVFLQYRRYPYNALPGMCVSVGLDKRLRMLARQKEVQAQIVILIRL